MNWINAKEQLPNKFENLLIFSQFFGIVIGYYDGKNYWENNETLNNVTHWMLLPKEPCD